MDPLKMLLIGMDGATPELLFEDDGLVNLRRLMEAGTYGPLESVIPPTGVPAWMCLATGMDPGSLGVYGRRVRSGRSYSSSRDVELRSMAEIGIWEQFASEGEKTVFLVSSSIQPQSSSSGDDRMSLRDEIITFTRDRFAEMRRLLQHEKWKSILLMEDGLNRIQSLSRLHHVQDKPANSNRDVVHDYVRVIDEELGGVLETLDEQTAVLVVSTHGARRCQGGFCVNQWLIREGLLTLRREPGDISPIDQGEIDWSKTRVWSEGGDCASLYFNVKDREPEGIVEPLECDSFRADVKTRLEATIDPNGRPMGTLVLEPETIYRAVHGAAPDLIVQFGGMAWRVIDGVGYTTLHLGPDEIEGETCPTSQGAFVLAVPGRRGAGFVEGASLLDLAPTLLELGGHEPAPQMQGRSLLNRALRGDSPLESELDAEELLIRERLSGLGYLG